MLVGTLLQVGGTIGAFGLAWLIARGGFLPMLAATFALATVSIAFIGQPGISLRCCFVIVFVAGWCIVGGQPGINALSATYYPTYLRSTGVGAGLGVGRVGAIVGPYIGGMLLAQQWSRSSCSGPRRARRSSRRDHRDGHDGAGTRRDCAARADWRIRRRAHAVRALTRVGAIPLTVSVRAH